MKVTLKRVKISRLKLSGSQRAHHGYIKIAMPPLPAETFQRVVVIKLIAPNLRLILRTHAHFKCVEMSSHIPSHFNYQRKKAVFLSRECNLESSHSM